MNKYEIDTSKIVRCGTTMLSAMSLFFLAVVGIPYLSVYLGVPWATGPNLLNLCVLLLTTVSGVITIPVNVVVARHYFSQHFDFWVWLHHQFPAPKQQPKHLPDPSPADWR